MGEAPVGCRFRGRARGVAVAVSVDVRFILERDIRSRGVEANVELVKEHGQNTLKTINPFTATLAALSLGKWPIEVPNLKSLRLFHTFAWARERNSIKIHSTESKFLQGHQIYYLQTCTCMCALFSPDILQAGAGKGLNKSAAYFKQTIQNVRNRAVGGGGGGAVRPNVELAKEHDQNTLTAIKQKCRLFNQTTQNMCGIGEVGWGEERQSLSYWKDTIKTHWRLLNKIADHFNLTGWGGEGGQERWVNRRTRSQKNTKGC